ncbi:MAG: right-handed parallel beta-helix repeat-containing protein [Bacteroidota bacterium]|nr:right-handed parallel beta-helix repeat-containing protein [Bacteroidota bacterium]
MLYKKSTQILFLLSFLLSSFPIFATTYYVSSSSGSDYNSGTSSSSPWQSLSKVNSFYNFQPGDNILFKRGDSFYGNISINNSGNSGNPITFGAYGSGAKPVITGFTWISSWTNLGGNIWESTNQASNLSTANIVLINGVNTPMGRYPNSGFLSFQSHGGNYSITSSSLNGSPNWTGAKVVIRANRWTFVKQTITSQSGGTLYYSNGSANPIDNFGFFIEDDSRTLDAQGEWYYNPNTKKIDIYSTSQPNSVAITTVETLISSNHQNNITIDNLDLRGANTTAISIGNSQNPKITNCDISYTGVFGIEVNNSSSYADIESNNISDCGSSSIESDDFGPYYTIKYNNIKRTGLVSPILPNDYNGAAINSPSNYALIQYNQIDSSAYDGISFRGTNTQVRNNFVNHSCMIRDDGAGIYTGFAGEAGKVIDGNIILNSVGNSAGTASNEIHCSGIYIDDLGNNVTISNNSVANSSSAGIFIHNGNNINVKNNTVYNSGSPGTYVTGSLCLQAGGTSMIRGVTINNNIFVAKTTDQICFFYFSPTDATDMKAFGSSDYNSFVNPLGNDQSIIFQPTFSWPGVVMNLAAWQTYDGQDANSTTTPKTISSAADERFEYNPTSSSKTIALDANYIDSKWNNYNGSITLAPYSSAVLIKNGASTNLLPAVNPSNTVNGLNYSYYEASDYTSLPDFSSSTPIKSGTVNTFDISVANRSNDYSINYTGYINVPADGQYTFYTTSDDGSKLYIDNNLVVDNNAVQSATERSGTIGLKAGLHAITVGYFQQAGGSVLSVSYSGPGLSKQVIPNSSLYRISTSSNLLAAVNPSNTVNGLNYSYYEAASYSSVPDFSTATPVKTGTVNTFDISVANRNYSYSINYTGYVNVPADGQYTFYTTSDDGSKLYIDNVLVVNNDAIQAATEKTGTIGLKAGLHAITVGYFQQAGDNVLSVSYSGPGVGKQVIPNSSLYRVSSSSSNTSASSNLLPAVNASNTVNGLNYSYYEAASYSSVPDFSAATPIKTGTVNTFDISVANRNYSYSINYTGYVNVPADGQYTFYTTSDDGSKLYIDNVLVVNNDGIQAATEKSGTIGLKAGLHAITVGYFQQLGDNVLSVSYAGPGVGKQVIPNSSLYRVSSSNLLPAVNPSSTVNGLNYSYYEAAGYSSVPDFSTATPIKTGTVNTFDISVANRNYSYSINFSGYVNVPADGQYTFYTTSDDGSKLYIDNVLVVNNDAIQAATENSGTIGLKAGLHAITVGYFQQLGDNVLSVSYSGPSVVKQFIPSSSLFMTTAASLLNQSVMVNRSSALMFNNDGSNFQMQRLLNNSQIAPGVKVFPNPFSNSIQIDVNGGNSSKIKLSLIDASGKTVWIKKVDYYTTSFHETVNTSALPVGVYFLKLMQNGNISTTKLLKEY